MQSWLLDATQNSSVVADNLLKQLYHWVSNPGSAVHHPALHNALLDLMRRLFVVLVEEMKRLGATVVAANFNTVLIYTGRRNLTAAGGEGGRGGWIYQVAGADGNPSAYM
jgi:DNA polymerase epsilon subunit 1